MWAYGRDRFRYNVSAPSMSNRNATAATLNHDRAGAPVTDLAGGYAWAKAAHEKRSYCMPTTLIANQQFKATRSATTLTSPMRPLKSRGMPVCSVAPTRVDIDSRRPLPPRSWYRATAALSTRRFTGSLSDANVPR